MSYLELGIMDADNTEGVQDVELLIGIFFIIEFIFNIMVDYGSLF